MGVNNRNRSGIKQYMQTHMQTVTLQQGEQRGRSLCCSVRSLLRRLREVGLFEFAAKNSVGAYQVGKREQCSKVWKCEEYGMLEEG